MLSGKKNTVLAEDPHAISNLYGSLKLFMNPVPGKPTSSDLQRNKALTRTYIKAGKTYIHTQK